MMMGKNVATAVLVLAGTVGIASACDGPYIDKCDIDGCATGSYVCPAACQQKHVSSFNGMITCACSGCAEAQSCEEQFSKQICDELGPLAEVYASMFALFIILAIIYVAFPCIVFGCAYCTCVQNKQQLGRSPSGAAWATCCGVFWVGAILLGIFIPFGYLIFSGIMVIPFCMDGCYTQPVGLGANIIVQTAAPGYVQAPQQQYAQAPQQYAQAPQQYAQAPQQYAQQPVQAVPAQAVGPKGF